MRIIRGALVALALAGTLGGCATYPYTDYSYNYPYGYGYYYSSYPSYTYPYGYAPYYPQTTIGPSGGGGGSG